MSSTTDEPALQAADSHPTPTPTINQSLAEHSAATADQEYNSRYGFLPPFSDNPIALGGPDSVDQDSNQSTGYGLESNPVHGALDGVIPQRALSTPVFSPHPESPVSNLPAPIIPKPFSPESDPPEPSLPNPVLPRYLLLHPLTLDPLYPELIPQDPSFQGPARQDTILQEHNSQEASLSELFPEEDEQFELQEEVLLEPHPNQVISSEPARHTQHTPIPHETAAANPAPVEPAPVKAIKPAQAPPTEAAPAVHSAEVKPARPPVVITATCNYCGAVA
ncbi:hypothetical protein N0V85_008007 [Neurospora sp. IMI 360204]|nr:hypothetical protein N0V85_008007 [Neurospora sp. IMI 360204]